ncbi:MAG: branched-chain amino acid ABC transporter permease [Nitrososphaerota archaeon]|nr:branched-chain amino acid ABC transporter permease [Nitrososphaerota archaeon]
MLDPSLAVLFNGQSVISFLILGAVLGIVYTLLSEGFGLMYGVGGILNGAYGALYMVTDYFIFTLFTLYKVQIFVAILLSLAIVFVLAVIIQKFVVGRGKSTVDALFLTLALAFVIQYFVAFLQCSSTFKTACQHPAFVPVFIRGSTSLLGVSVSNQQLVADGVSILLLAALWMMLTRTGFGRGIRAVSQDRAAAELVGINSQKTMLITSGLASVMAGVSSAFLASYQTVSPTSGWDILTLAFAIVILGGLGSLKGAVVASFILAYAQTFVLLFVNSLLADFASLTILIIVLLVRPQGLFGKEVT